jgi:hypothetical protein
MLTVSETPGRRRKALPFRETTGTRDGDTASSAVSRISGMPQRLRGCWIALSLTKRFLQT